MPNPKLPDTTSNPTVSSAKLDRKLRLSLPEKEKSPKPEVGSRRNTISEESLPRTRKKPKHLTPTIPEDEDESGEKVAEFVIVNEVKKSNSSGVSRTASAASKTSAVSSKSAKSTFTYDNAAFEGNVKPTTSSEATSRTPSVRSLEVYREQYCCCAKRTKCERYLLVSVTILLIIVVVLIIVIAVLAKNVDSDGKKIF